MRMPTKFVATFSVNDGNVETMEHANKSKMVDELRKIIREQAGESGCGQYEIRKVYTSEERKLLSVPDNINGQVIELADFSNGRRWTCERPFKKYF